ncbi:MAG TPA: hypothetical protein ENH01_03150 [Nitrospirae bacterium]|nr:hypothetical protein [Nitrospirota bacterium]
MMNDEHLIDRLKEKYKDHDTTNFNVFDFLHAFGSGFEALFYSMLFWPEFIEIDDMIFLKGTIENDEDRQRLTDTFEKYGKDRFATEKDFNCIEISYLFGPRTAESTEEEDLWLAERLVEMWRCRLQVLYPKRNFVVNVLDPRETNNEVAILFFQKDDTKD